VNDKLIGKNVKGSGRGLILRYYPRIDVEGLTETMKNLSHVSRSSRRDLNQRPPEYEEF
jgi:hypothetical protein